MSANKKSNQTKQNHLHSTEARWFAVYTKYKAEKFVAEKLQKKGIEAYVPLLHYTRKYKSKTKQVALPLISCYVFVRITKEDYVRVLQTEHVIHFLQLRSNLIAIPDDEIQTLKWVVGEKMDVQIHENKGFNTGAHVEVIAGNLTGLKGKIIKQKNKKFFVVELETMGYALEVNISQDLLQLTQQLRATG